MAKARNGRRALRDEIQSTWVVYEPVDRLAGFRREDMEAANLVEPPQPGTESSPDTHCAEPCHDTDGGTTTTVVE